MSHEVSYDDLPSSFIVLIKGTYPETKNTFLYLLQHTIIATGNPFYNPNRDDVPRNIFKARTVDEMDIFFLNDLMKNQMRIQLIIILSFESIKSRNYATYSGKVITCKRDANNVCLFTIEILPEEKDDIEQ